MQPTQIDENGRNTGGGRIQGTSLTLPFFVKSTGELLIEIIPVVSIGTVIAPRNLAIDENERVIGGAITDDVNKDIIPLTCDMIIDLPCLRIEI